MPDERLRHDQFRAATAPRRPVERLFATIFVVVLCFCAICGKVLLDARQAAWERAAEFANEPRRDHRIRYRPQHRELRSVAAGRHRQSGPSRNHQNQLRSCASLSCSIARRWPSTWMRSFFSTRTASSAWIPGHRSRNPTSRADRDYFEFHQNSSSLHVAHQPAHRCPRDRHPRHRGEPAIVEPGRHVCRRGGRLGAAFVFPAVVQERGAWPQRQHQHCSARTACCSCAGHYEETMLGRDLKRAGLFKHLALARSGLFESESATDGVHRLFVYRQIGDLPLVIAVGQSTSRHLCPMAHLCIHHRPVDGAAVRDDRRAGVVSLPGNEAAQYRRDDPCDSRHDGRPDGPVQPPVISTRP